MEIQELVLNPYHDQHTFSVPENSTPLKVLYHGGVMRLMLRAVPGNFKTLRISRYRSHNQIPNGASYIDSIGVDGTTYHYFEMEN